MAIYPTSVVKALDAGRKVRPAKLDAIGKAATFVCGCGIDFRVRVDGTVVENAAAYTNGCGYMAASANSLANWLCGKELSELYGLADDDLRQVLLDILNEIPEARRHCVGAVLEAIHACFAHLRSTRVASYDGDAVLVCSCFGVDEDTITRAIGTPDAASLERVGEITRAGTGCGACRLTIEGMIDGLG